jgi:hypothetical protein
LAISLSYITPPLPRQTLGAVEVERTPPRACRSVRRGVSGVLGFAQRTCDIPTVDVFSPPKAPGSVLLRVGDAADSVSLLLIPEVCVCANPPPP